MDLLYLWNKRRIQKTEVVCYKEHLQKLVEYEIWWRLMSKKEKKRTQLQFPPPLAYLCSKADVPVKKKSHPL